MCLGGSADVYEQMAIVLVRVGLCGCGCVRVWVRADVDVDGMARCLTITINHHQRLAKAIESVKPFKRAKSRPSAIHLAREWVDSSKESMPRASKQESQRGKSCERHP